MHRPSRDASPACFKGAFALVGLAAWLWLNAAIVSAEARNLKLIFVDSGGGDTIIIQSVAQELTLVDTGLDLSASALLRTHKGLARPTIKNLVLTHPHRDHVNGVFALLRSLSVGAVYDNAEDLGRVQDDRQFFRRYSDLVRKHANYQSLRKGDKLDLNGALLEVLWPPRATLERDWNSNSLVLMLSFGAFRCLLMGDANSDTERELLKSGVPLEAQVLKAGHHARADNGSEEFLSAVRPETVVITASQDMQLEPPAPETIARYQKASSRICRPDIDGDVVIEAHLNGSYKLRP